MLEDSDKGLTDYTGDSDMKFKWAILINIFLMFLQVPVSTGS